MILRTLLTWISVLSPAIFIQTSIAQDSPHIKVQMDATRIRSHTELPKLLYIVPWRDTDLIEESSERKILIPDLFSDYYEPMHPGDASDDGT